MNSPYVGKFTPNKKNLNHFNCQVNFKRVNICTLQDIGNNFALKHGLWKLLTFSMLRVKCRRKSLVQMWSALHYSEVHYITVQCITLQWSALHYSTVRVQYSTVRVQCSTASCRKPQTKMYVGMLGSQLGSFPQYTVSRQAPYLLLHPEPVQTRRGRPRW